MNEKIRELMMQAGEYAKSVWVDPTEENYVSWHDLFNEKFVELILKECSKVIVNGGYRNPALGEKHPLTPPEIDTMIKEHFGVEW